MYFHRCNKGHSVIWFEAKAKSKYDPISKHWLRRGFRLGSNRYRAFLKNLMKGVTCRTSLESTVDDLCSP